ncbi:transposase [Actinacidiphila reveromycinica]|uniref:transposase n=1 Tax=Actinacidiphila reveromycinica TaxID=659352 RepID=UPI003D2BBDAF
MLIPSSGRSSERSLRVGQMREGVSVKLWVVDDDLWAMIGSVLPPCPSCAPGPRPVPDRLCLQGILFVLYTGIPWQQLRWSWALALVRPAGDAWSDGRTPVSSTGCTGYSSPS